MAGKELMRSMGKRACPTGEATIGMLIYPDKQAESPTLFGQSGVVGGVKEKRPRGESTKMAHVKHGERGHLPEPPVKVAVVQIGLWSCTAGF